MSSPAPRAGAAFAAALPFLVVGALFAGALLRHLGAPQRERQAFERALAEGRGAAAVADDDHVLLVRTPCRGGCAAYRVRVDGSGRVAFQGWQLACAGPVWPQSIDPAAARRLIAAIERAGFADWPDLGHRDDPHRGLTILELGRGAQSRRRVFNEGGPDDPPQLAAIARAVDSVAGVARWRPGPDGRCPPAGASSAP